MAEWACEITRWFYPIVLVGKIGPGYASNQQMVASALLCVLVVGMGNDGWVVYNGSPELIGPHKSIQMVREAIVMHVGKEFIRVTCDFVFKNHGEATEVTMGFPDYDSSGEPRGPELKQFRSWVDGVRVKTKYSPSKTEGVGWHMKTVAFGRGAVRKVRNSYRAPLGGLRQDYDHDDDRPFYRFWGHYTFSTGGSWYGTIGQSDLEITFDRDAPVAPGNLTIQPELPREKEESYSFWRRRRDMIEVDSPAKPTIKGRTIRIKMTNWKPDLQSDVDFLFGVIKPA